ncbi:MAG: hypothetical protein JWQ49_5536 [Edaphobacter sp.]|nr:hypothetical protein [Edaphobacter sp.]
MELSLNSSLPFVLSACFVSIAAFGQTPSHSASLHKPNRTFVAGSANEVRATQLPVTHVSLYKNGVGFFEHAGRVSGDEAVTIDLTSAQLNDVLQSLTAIDLNGGRITGASYNSTTPLEQQLRALPLSLGEAPTQQDLYDSLRGARVEVTGAGGGGFSGRIISLETRALPAGNDESKRESERRFLTVVADAGATRTLELTSATTVRLLDTRLRGDLNTYLELLDRNRTEGVRHLTLTDRGTGSRDLRVSFLSEVPVWKSTYRILFTDNVKGNGVGSSNKVNTATLQGFSVVDNTTGEDWNNVQLSLIAGSPQSFLQPLSQPIYARRPEVPIVQDAQFTPQTHASALEVLKENGAPPVVAGTAGMSGIGMGRGSGVPGGVMGAIGSAPAQRPRDLLANQSHGIMLDSNAPPMIPYETVAAKSITPNTTTAAFDDFFAYNLTDPVTIPRNGSALVPILQTRIESERVTLWSPSAPMPLRALWITNTSDLTVDRGSFSIVEDGAFGGEGLLETIHPGEKRLLSYAVDEAVHVSVDQNHDTRRVTMISASNGVLRATSAEVAEVEYLVHNAAPDARMVVVEQPRRAGWDLDSDPKPEETTPTAYRFRVATEPKQTVRLHIGERHTLDQYFRLVDSTDQQLTVFLRNAKASSAVMQQLEPVFAAKRAVAALDAQIREKQDAINQLVNDQKRLRDNLSALKGSAEERSLVKRYTAELNAQEDTLAMLRRDLAALQQQRQAANTDLNNQIEALTLNEKIDS